VSAPDERKILNLLNELGASINLTCLDVLDSTNLEAKRRAATGERLPMLVTAGSQTAGRGRLGRSFYSPEDTGVYMTVMFLNNSDFGSAVTITTAAAVAVCRAVEAVTGLSPDIKWVNDIYLNGRKVCGILAESSLLNRGHVIAVGIGINVTTETFPEELGGIAGSLGTENIREELIARTAAELLKVAGRDPAEYMDYYRSRSVVIGREIMFGPHDGEKTPATALGIDDRGGLIVRLPGGEEKTLFTGEITVRLAE